MRGIAPLALEALEQAGLVAGDVGAGAAVHDDLEVEARAEDVLAEEALRVRVGDRLLQPLGTRARTRPAGR